MIELAVESLSTRDIAGTSNITVSIIIVTRGVNNYIKSCIDSIKAQTYTDFEITVIDNSLNQSFTQDFKHYYPSAKLYSSPKNLFYCEALNKGITMSRGSFILCLNDDVILDKRFIERAVRGFSIDKRIGMVSGKILRQDGKTIDSTGLFLSRWYTARERGYGIKDRGQFEKEDYIFGVNGAVAFYRRDMLDEVKINSEYFDSDFRFFYEDLDIAWRGQRKGWRAYYIPEAIAYHIRGGTARAKQGINKSFARLYLNDELHLDLIKNRYLAIIKNESFFRFFLHLPFMFLYDFLLWSYILFFRPRQIKEFILNLGYRKSALKKRKMR